jgi:hypothetical protein
MLRPNNFWRVGAWNLPSVYIHVWYDFRKMRPAPDLLKSKYCVSRRVSVKVYRVLKSSIIWGLLVNIEYELFT